VPTAEVRRALDVLVEYLVDRLGDSNLRLHESARKCVLFCAEHEGLLGLGAVLTKLLQRLGKAGKGGERAKVHFGILDTVNFLLQHFPGRREDGHCDEDEEGDECHTEEDSWTQYDVAPFVVAGMEDSLGPRVRSCAVALAVTVYQTFGMDAMRPLLAELKPAKQALLKQKFQESEGMDFEGEDGGQDGDGGEDIVLRSSDLECLVVCGNAIKPPPQLAAPALPGCVNTDYDEEVVMDGILEETGAVFHGSGIYNEAGRSMGRSMNIPPGFLESQLDLTGMDLEEEDQRLLEEELMSLGLADLEGLDEQQALLMSLQDGHGQMSRHSLSVEVF